MKIKFSQNFLLLFLSLILLLGLSNRPLYSQILIGPKIGGRMSWVNFDEPAKDIYKARPVFGYSGGIATAFNVRKRFFLQVDFMYTRKGKRIKGVDDPRLSNKAVYHYLNVPIIYRVDFKSNVEGIEFKWFMGAGPNVSYWWKGNGTLTSSELDENDIDKLDYEVSFDYDPDLTDANKLYAENINRVQFGLLFAAGLVFEPAPHQSLVVELRYEWGHSYLADDQGRYRGVLGYKDDLRARNQGLQLSISYLFDTMIAQRKKGKSTYGK